MDLLSGFADISLAQLLLVALVALIAAVIGGVSGYGNGALIGPSHGGYFPTTGRAPRLGRKEVDVPRPPHTSENFFRSFNVQSDQTPITPPQSTPPQPPIVVAPETRRRHHP